ncbi:unnamed protein product [Periconia digitata]|uniref:Uncharacterized protein n=1 Tax=Periconia digitata TaxID=1303443 RepID=A0A9W4U2S9_9PLEO|nr:unnamed protein product [Periconia digitata]
MPIFDQPALLISQCLFPWKPSSTFPSSDAAYCSPSGSFDCWRLQPTDTAASLFHHSPRRPGRSARVLLCPRRKKRGGETGSRAGGYKQSAKQSRSVPKYCLPLLGVGMVRRQGGRPSFGFKVVLNGVGSGSTTSMAQLCHLAYASLGPRIPSFVSRTCPQHVAALSRIHIGSAHLLCSLLSLYILQPSHLDVLPTTCLYADPAPTSS